MILTRLGTVVVIVAIGLVVFVGAVMSRSVWPASPLARVVESSPVSELSCQCQCWTVGILTPGPHLEATSTPIATQAVTASVTATPVVSGDWQIWTALHLSVIPVADLTAPIIWRVVWVGYEDEYHSGGRHNVYYRTEIVPDHAQYGVWVCLGMPWAPYLDCSHKTEDRDSMYPIGYGADYPIWSTGWNPSNGPGPYQAWVEDQYPSEVLTGFGLPMAQHVNFYVVFRRVGRG